MLAVLFAVSLPLSATAGGGDSSARNAVQLLRSLDEQSLDLSSHVIWVDEKAAVWAVEPFAGWSAGAGGVLLQAQELPAMGVDFATSHARWAQVSAAAIGWQRALAPPADALSSHMEAGLISALAGADSAAELAAWLAPQDFSTAVTLAGLVPGRGVEWHTLARRQSEDGYPVVYFSPVGFPSLYLRATLHGSEWTDVYLSDHVTLAGQSELGDMVAILVDWNERRILSERLLELLDQPEGQLLARLVRCSVGPLAHQLLEIPAQEWGTLLAPQGDVVRSFEDELAELEASVQKDLTTMGQRRSEELGRRIAEARTVMRSASERAVLRQRMEFLSSMTQAGLSIASTHQSERGRNINPRIEKMVRELDDVLQEVASGEVNFDQAFLGLLQQNLREHIGPLRALDALSELEQEMVEEMVAVVEAVVRGEPIDARRLMQRATELAVESRTGRRIDLSDGGRGALENILGELISEIPLPAPGDIWDDLRQIPVPAEMQHIFPDGRCYDVLGFSTAGEAEGWFVFRGLPRDAARGFLYASLADAIANMEDAVLVSWTSRPLGWGELLHFGREWIDAPEQVPANFLPWVERRF